LNTKSLDSANQMTSKIFKIECVGSTKGGIPMEAISGTYRVYFPESLKRILVLHECYSEDGDEPLNGNEELKKKWQENKRIYHFEAQRFGFVPKGFFYEGIIVGKDGVASSAAIVLLNQ